MRKTYYGNIDGPTKKNQILIIGTNTQGRHGKGIALLGMLKWGAIYGRSTGLQGQCWGICTKDLTKRNHFSISEESIIKQIDVLYQFAKDNPELEFIIPYKGEGDNLNGYTPEEMAKMFNRPEIPENIKFEEKFWRIILTENLNKI